MNERNLIEATIWIAAAVLFMVASPGFAGTITGSKHDYTTSAWSGGRICVACHTPHKADMSVTDAPLWNHKNSTQTYTTYTSVTMNATVGQPGSTSKLCMSCHDGTVAVDSFGGATGTTLISAIPGARPGSNLGTSLADDHPIGFTYNTALATTDGSLFDPATKTITIGTGTQTKTGTVNAVLLYGGKMECASCHDVHNTFTVGTTGLTKMSQAGSQLCYACHNK